MPTFKGPQVLGKINKAHFLSHMAIALWIGLLTGAEILGIHFWFEAVVGYTPHHILLE